MTATERTITERPARVERADGDENANAAADAGPDADADVDDQDDADEDSKKNQIWNLIDAELYQMCEDNDTGPGVQNHSGLTE